MKEVGQRGYCLKHTEPVGTQFPHKCKEEYSCPVYSILGTRKSKNSTSCTFPRGLKLHYYYLADQVLEGNLWKNLVDGEVYHETDLLVTLPDLK